MSLAFFMSSLSALARQQISATDLHLIVSNAVLCATKLPAAPLRLRELSDLDEMSIHAHGKISLSPVTLRR